MDVKSSIERRCFSRFDCALPAEYRTIGFPNNDVLTGSIKNVSEGGTRLVTDNFIPLNSRLVLVFNFPFKNRKIKSLCKIVWTKRFATLAKYDLGVEFLDMTLKCRDDMAAFIRNKLS
ncbi:MAG: PilZ domain-containing protein [Candidatus Omnitrophica bacterium]|nr:PilZ domain-containing protein [Candidatus Omnitrophota bacterium]